MEKLLTPLDRFLANGTQLVFQHEKKLPFSYRLVTHASDTFNAATNGMKTFGAKWASVGGNIDSKVGSYLARNYIYSGVLCDTDVSKQLRYVNPPISHRGIGYISRILASPQRPGDEGKSCKNNLMIEFTMPPESALNAIIDSYRKEDKMPWGETMTDWYLRNCASTILLPLLARAQLVKYVVNICNELGIPIPDLKCLIHKNAVTGKQFYKTIRDRNDEFVQLWGRNKYPQVPAKRGAAPVKISAKLILDSITTEHSNYQRHLFYVKGNGTDSEGNPRTVYGKNSDGDVVNILKEFNEVVIEALVTGKVPHCQAFRIPGMPGDPVNAKWFADLLSEGCPSFDSVEEMTDPKVYCKSQIRYTSYAEPSKGTSMAYFGPEAFGGYTADMRPMATSFPTITTFVPTNGQTYNGKYIQGRIPLWMQEVENVDQLCRGTELLWKNACKDVWRQMEESVGDDPKQTRGFLIADFTGSVLSNPVGRSLTLNVETPGFLLRLPSMGGGETVDETLLGDLQTLDDIMNPSILTDAMPGDDDALY